MQAKFGTFVKEKNSTAIPSDSWGTVYNVSLKENTSLHNPILILKTTNTYNYASFRGRWYFVDEIVYTTNEVTEYHLSEDVLATWRVDIGLSQQYVTRSAIRYDTNIVDNLYPAKNKTSSTTRLLDSLHNQVYNPLGGEGFWIVGLIGAQTSTSGCVNYFYLTSAGFKNLMGYAFNVLNYGISASELSYGVQKLLVNPMQYVVSATWYPFGITPVGTSTYVSLGWWTTEIGGFLINNNDRNMQFSSGAIELPIHPQSSTNGYYLNAAPFTHYTLIAYMFGSIPLDPVSFPFNESGKKIAYVTIRCDIFTGAGELFVANYTGEVVYKASSNMGVSSILSNMTQNTAGLVNGAFQIFENGLTMGAFGELVGESGIGSAAGSFGTQVSTTGSQGSSIAYNFAPRICAEFIEVADIDTEHQGRPLCKTVRINTLNGYVKVADADVEIAGTKAEHDEIVTLMENGFYYE